METVLLTGISGYVGQHCAVELLRHGFRVRGTVRNLNKKDEVLNGIKKEIDPKDNIEFVKLDLLSDEGWDDAMAGCAYVLHVASPFFVKEPKDEAEYIAPAKQGTMRAVEAAYKAKVKKIVITSSIVAMMGDKVNEELNQNSWTNEHSKNINVYMKSKTIAEKAAWDFYKNQPQHEDYKLEMSTIHPGGVFGPTLTGNVSGQSLTMIKQMITGHWKMSAIPNASMPMSDVRDVAKLHALSLTAKETNGKRVIVASEKGYSFMSMAKTLKENGFDKVSTKKAPSIVLKFASFLDKEVKGMMPFLDINISSDISLAKSLGWEPIAFEKTLIDTANSIKDL